MPSGFTAPLYEGEQDFVAFVQRCARGMGALVTEREEPLDAPLPDAFVPQPYFEDQFIATREALDAFHDADDAERRRWQVEEQTLILERWSRSKVENEARARRYGAMLAQVEAWQPPTEDHLGLKKFMLEQLASAIDFDILPTPDAPRLVPFDQWVGERSARLKQSAQRAAESFLNESYRCEERTAWVQALKASLEGAGVSDG